MTARFVGLDPAEARTLAAEWQRAGVRWTTWVDDAHALSGAMLLDALHIDVGRTVIERIDLAARLLSERADVLSEHGWPDDDLGQWLSGGARGYFVSDLMTATDDAWAAMVARGTVWDGSRAIRWFDFQPDPGAGVVVVDVFIPERGSLFLDGDDRGHEDPVFGPLTGEDSRAVVVLDAERGRGTIQFDDTCTVLGGCNPARPITLDGSPVAFDEHGTLDVANQVQVERGGGSITVDYDILNGIVPIGSTDGTFTLTNRGDGRYVVGEFDGDEYPSIGIYQYRAPGQVDVLLQRDSEGFGHLLPWWPELRDLPEIGDRQNGRSTLH